MNAKTKTLLSWATALVLLAVLVLALRACLRDAEPTPEGRAQTETNQLKKQNENASRAHADSLSDSELDAEYRAIRDRRRSAGMQTPDRGPEP